MTIPMKGHCNCGTIQVQIAQTESPIKISLCHCLDCRASGGTLFAVNMLVPSSAFSITSEVQPKSYSAKAASGNTSIRHFCGRCGSPIMTTVPENPNLTFVKGGLFRSSGFDLDKPFKEQWFRRAEGWERAYVEPGSLIQ